MTATPLNLDHLLRSIDLENKTQRRALAHHLAAYLHKEGILEYADRDYCYPVHEGTSWTKLHRLMHDHKDFPDILTANLNEHAPYDITCRVDAAKSLKRGIRGYLHISVIYCPAATLEEWWLRK